MLRTITLLQCLILCNQLMAQKTFEIPADQIKIDGKSMGVEPGDTLYLLGGVRESIRFENLEGTDEQPIIIINKNEKVIIDTEAHSGIDFRYCSFFRLTGTGGPDKYGIEVATAGTMGIIVSEFSTECEVDHLEIHHVGFAGIMAKTDPSCSRQDLRSFVMRNISFHDNLIYETGGEGFYIGYSWYPFKEVECNGNTITLYPHPIYGVEIYNNYIHDTHWDGLQVGSSSINVRIYGNKIENYGLDNELYQNHGVQIGAGTTGDFFNNYISGGTGGGISFFGIGNNRLFNNVIVNTGGSAIYQNDKGAILGSTYEICNNTIINPIGMGIDLTATITLSNLVANNLIVLGDYTLSGIIGAGLKWISETNQYYTDTASVKFMNPLMNDFRLKPTSGAVDHGKEIPFLLYDYNYLERPANGVYDVGAFEYGAEPFVASPLKVDESNSTGLIEVYPNPSDGSLNIQLTEQAVAYPEINIEMYDQMGKFVYNQMIPAGQNKMIIDLPALSSGVYLLKVKSGNKNIESHRWMKK